MSILTILAPICHDTLDFHLDLHSANVGTCVIRFELLRVWKALYRKDLDTRLHRCFEKLRKTSPRYSCLRQRPYRNIALYPTGKLKAISSCRTCRIPLVQFKPFARHAPRWYKAGVAEESHKPETASLTTSAIKSPQTDASVLNIGPLQPAQLFLGGRELLGGREVEESALKKCVELHERWQRQEAGPVLNTRWQGIST